ncbi:hypothetical protein EB796_017772 [Bugula neritina]|uniref:Uncharacterized protein n=1 Tax=Bugula neritina TaxID=10212 RepID=A0A7J7JCD2_BUGNE|nr:hypothetical protein EB796_017772 [Bugula neritina]
MKVASPVIAAIGIIQLLSAIVITGLAAKNISDVLQDNSNTRTDKVNAASPIIVALVVMGSGIIGILSIFCGGVSKVVYLVSATISMTASCGIIWLYALIYSNCKNITIAASDDPVNVCGFDQATSKIYTVLLIFSCIAAAISAVGMLISSISTCSRLPSDSD